MGSTSCCSVVVQRRKCAFDYCFCSIETSAALESLHEVRPLDEPFQFRLEDQILKIHILSSQNLSFTTNLMLLVLWRRSRERISCLSGRNVATMPRKSIKHTWTSLADRGEKSTQGSVEQMTSVETCLHAVQRHWNGLSGTREHPWGQSSEARVHLAPGRHHGRMGDPVPFRCCGNAENARGS